LADKLVGGMVGHFGQRRPGEPEFVDDLFRLGLGESTLASHDVEADDNGRGHEQRDAAPNRSPWAVHCKVPLSMVVCLHSPRSQALLGNPGGPGTVRFVSAGWA